jgi:O-glycosyl hydrolase
MKKMKKFLFALVALLLAALLFNSCPNDDPADDEDLGVGGVANNFTPFNWITVHPTSADYVGANPTIEELKVETSLAGTETVTYQWYKAESFKNSDGEEITDATNATYTPPVTDIQQSNDGGFYYVVVTREKGEDTQTQASNPARIRVLAAAPAAPTTTVTITSTNQQYVRGFGGMSNAFGIGAPARYMEMKDIETMFNPETGLGFNILRIMLWPDPLEDVISGEVEPQMRNQTTYIQAVKKVNEYGGYVMASPWSPPPDYKANGAILGEGDSQLLPRYYKRYADHLKTYASKMAAAGAPIYALSIQNEPTWPASYAGCKWSGAQQRDFFLTDGVGKFTQGVSGWGGGKAQQVKIMSGEPHDGVKSFHNETRNNPTAHGIVDIYAFHTYGNHNNKTTAIQADNDANRKELWMTEWNQNSGAGQYLQDSTWNFVWIFVNAVDNDVRCDNVNAYVWWYTKRFYCFIGDNSYGTVNGEIQPRGYAFSHYAKYATDTIRIPAVVNGHPAGGNANDLQTQTGYDSSVNVKASAFRRKPTSQKSGYWEEQVKADEDSISLVIYDQRTSAGTVEEPIRVSLPADFGEAKFAHAIISDSTGKRHAPHLVVLTENGTKADFNLPANSIVSIKFTK